MSSEPSSSAAAAVRARRLPYFSIRLRLTGLFTLIFGTMLVLFGSVLYQTFTADQQQELDIALYNYAVDVSRSIGIDAFGNITLNPDFLASGEKIFPFAIGNVFIEVLSPDGRELSRSSNLGKVHLPVFPTDWPLLATKRALFHTIDGRGLPLKGRRNAELASFRMLTSLAPGRDAPNFVIQVAAPDAFVELAAQRLRRFLGIGVPLSLLVAMFAGLYFSRRALRPVNDIIEKANRLSVDNLSERIPLPLVNDELRRLSVTLNALLDRLQRAFESQERFIADASHELKTPLAILRGELDVFRGRARSEQEISAFTVSAAQELDHLSRLVEDLLVLARVDAGSGVISKSETRLDELALETISRLQALARARDVKIKLDLDEKTESFAVQGDADLLRILFKNLIENAVKYSPSGESVGVRVGADGEFAVIRVKDHGPGIAREDQPKIFERFFRVKGDPTAERISGAGLGLAIARTIAEIHGGTLSVQSEVGIGSEFTAKVRRAAGP